MAYPDAVVAQARLWTGYREGSGNKDVFSGGMGRLAEAWCQDFVQLVALCQGLASAGPAASAPARRTLNRYGPARQMARSP
jgi:hypothetical protein